MTEENKTQLPKVKVELDVVIVSDAKPKKLSLKERIDSDAGLKSKRNALTWVSLVLLIVTFTGAVIEEANTFILKISLKQGEALSLLLVLAIIFLTIRYYSYARKYHEELTGLWKKDFFKDHLILNVDYETREPSGLLVEAAPKGFETDYPNLGHEEMHTDWDWYYQSKWFFLRYFVYEETDRKVGQDPITTWTNIFSVSIQDYATAIRIELKHRFLGYFNYPENLDIQAPYLIAIASIASLIFQDELSAMLTWILA